jgi:N6-adenosine-specific RNA methylase IME4
MQLTIDDRIKSHLPRLSEVEYNQLEENLLRDGCLTPLVVWGETLIDGHNRYGICQKHNIPFHIDYLQFESFEDVIDWVEDNQAGRRNANPDWFTYYIGRRYERVKKAPYRPSGKAPQNGGLLTSEKLAAEFNVGKNTVERAATFANNVDTIANHIGDSARSEILDGDVKLTRTEVGELSQDVQQAAEGGLKFASVNEALAWVKKEREKRSLERRQALNVVRQNRPALPAGKYETIIIDPPWDMQKIERDVAPNQVAFEYPTMTEEELMEFDVPSISANDCHIFCWTTHKFLPSAMRLIEAWGFRYVYLGTWHKNGGFQPFGLPQYNSEFYIYARRGSPKFVETKQFFTCFQADRREHSRKPDEFYDVIRRVTEGPRIDVFSREKRDGYDQFGNEENKFEGVTDEL